MVFLEAFNLAVSFSIGGNSFGGCSRRYGGCDIGHIIFDRGFSNVGIIFKTQLAAGSIDNKLNLPILYGVSYARTAFMLLQNQLGIY